jgi:hypothetical protein
MGRVFIPIFSVLGAATVAILSEVVAHNCFGIAIDAIRTTPFEPPLALSLF